MRTVAPTLPSPLAGEGARKGRMGGAAQSAARSLRDPRLRGWNGPRATKAEAIAMLREHLEKGTLTPMIDSVHAMEDFRQAFARMMEGETRGKVILRIASDNP